MVGFMAFHVSLIVEVEVEVAEVVVEVGGIPTQILANRVPQTTAPAIANQHRVNLVALTRHRRARHRRFLLVRKWFRSRFQQPSPQHRVLPLPDAVVLQQRESRQLAPLAQACIVVLAVLDVALLPS